MDENVPVILLFDLVELCLQEVATVGSEVPVDACYIDVGAPGVTVAVCHYCR